VAITVITATVPNVPKFGDIKPWKDGNNEKTKFSTINGSVITTTVPNTGDINP
jgi:hypothetical protein